MKKIAGVIISVLVAFLMIACAVLLYNGSLEMFPMAEQIEKGRIVWGICLALLAVIETFVVVNTVKAFKNR